MKVRMKALRDVTSVTHGGETFEVEDGHIEVPAEAVVHVAPHGFEVVSSVEDPSKQNELPPDIDLDKLDDDELAAVYEKVFGKAPKKKAKREQIIAELKA